MNDLEKLGARVAATQDRELTTSGAALRRARRRLLEPPAPRGRATRWVALAAAVAVVSVALVVGLRPAPLTFQVSGVEAAARLGEVVEPGPDQRASIRFSDESTVLLHAGARGRVEATTAHGARVVVESGLASVSVARKAEADWRFDVGPFRVRITGTRFDVEWNAGERRFQVDVQDGSVVVSGPLLEGERSVVAGERLVVSVRDGRVSPESLASAARHAPPPTESATAAEPPGGAATAKEPPATAASARATASAAAAPSASAAARTWRELARAGDYRAALASAEADGIDGVLASASADELVLFGDAARLGGRGELARRAYLAARDRSPGSRAAGVAAFALGRMGGAAALGWFDTYLREQPRGPLAREALGRVLELHHAAKNDAAARAAASRYLAEHPGGPYAALARALLGTGTTDAAPAP
ncbi:MAG: FecR domain-containing protein [Polyangiaceae bacterium]|nr:FecR domain-containing protein [Polyangiaceae bacterium]